MKERGISVFTTNPAEKRKTRTYLPLKIFLGVGILGFFFPFFLLTELVKRCNRAPVCLCILSSKHHDQKQKCHKAYSWERKQQEQILLMAKKLHETSSRQPAAVD